MTWRATELNHRPLSLTHLCNPASGQAVTLYCKSVDGGDGGRAQPVVIALQTSGGRLQAKFTTATTGWEMLETFEAQAEDGTRFARLLI